MPSKTFLNHPLRVTSRGLWLLWQFLVAALDYALTTSWRSKSTKPVRRAAWLQRNSVRNLRVCRTSWTVSGSVPQGGLLVTNHLTYLDVLVLAAITPAAFVAKREVRGWPLLGWFAHVAGTIFVHREKRSHVTKSNQEIEDAINTGVLLVLFAEGTSSDGSGVLPFKSALLEPVARPGRALTVGHIAYFLEDGDVGQEVCYWADMTLVPHLLNLLGKRTVRAHVSFAEVKEPSSDRKQLAKQLHAEVVRLKEKR